MNRNDLIQKMNNVSSELLREKGCISFVDTLLAMGVLKNEDYEAWRFRKAPNLEQMIAVNLSKINLMLQTLHHNAMKDGLRPSKTEYVAWGKGPKTPLKFCKSGDANIEEAYRTHFLRPKKAD